MSINPFSPCERCPLNRRGFLARTGMIAAASALGVLGAPGSAQTGTEKVKTRLRIIYSLHGTKQDRPDWPNEGFDFKPAMDRITGELKRRCSDFEFEPVTASGEEEARKIVQDDQSKSIDGYIVYQMNCWNRVVQAVAASGKPVLYADFQFGGSGGFLVYNAAFLRSQTPNVAFVASSRIKDLAHAVKAFEVTRGGGSCAAFVAAVNRERARSTPGHGSTWVREDPLKCLRTSDCLNQLKQSKILALRGQEPGAAGEIAGIKIEQVPFAELNEAWKRADKDETRAIADRWQKTAKKISGVTRETLESSAAMYMAEKALLKAHGAQGITINCLGGFYGGHIHAYPCLGFHELNNEGLVGGCECDVRSAATMLIGRTLTQGRPGYISDPVIDTAKRQIIYAHCVASNRVFGPEGRANPFEILTHSEDRQGASVRSFLPAGYMTTSMEFDQARKEVLLHRAVTVGNDPDDRACRTKLCAEPVGDIEKLFRFWDEWSWHRVTFYGDLEEPVQALADALGWKVVREA
jgi:hypothetical protein